MKRKCIIATVALFSILSASCNKTWQCECVTTTNRMGYPRTTSSHTTEITGTKGHAAAECEELSSYASSITTVCKLK